VDLLLGIIILAVIFLFIYCALDAARGL